jgi:capsular polysaccharide transport system ATP-binding protein
MILLSRVTDTPRVAGSKRLLADRVDLDLPVDRYALLTGDPHLRRPAIDLLARLRPPHAGHVTAVGSSSWPIGRPGFIRGKVTGRHIVALVARLYGLDMALSNGILETLLTSPAQLDELSTHWPIEFRREFVFAIALLPPFDIYIVDAPFPSPRDRFGQMWRVLFDERTEGKTLITSSTRGRDLVEFCSKAIIFDRGWATVTDRLEEALDQYPPVATPPERIDRQEEPDEEI